MRWQIAVVHWMVLVWFGLWPAFGCERGTLERVAVSASVTYRGEPLRSGIIVLVPDESRGTNGPLAQAEIQADGTGVFQTAGLPGVAPGWYRITLGSADQEPDQAGNLHWPDPPAPLPDKYRAPQTSGLCCEIRFGQDNRIRVELE